MPRLTREWDMWFASAEDLCGEVYLQSSNLSIAHPLLGTRIIYRKPFGINQKITLAQANTKLWSADSIRATSIASRVA
jgi:hypothetical protein